MAITWGTMKGEATSNKFEYVDFKKKTTNTVRIVSEPLARYVYWIRNEALGINAPFDCLRFNRETESWSGRSDPIQDMNIVQFNPFSKTKEQVKAARNYLAWVIDMEDGKLKLLDLKKSIFDSLGETMATLAQLGTPVGIYDIEFTITKKGTGKDTTYSINTASAIGAAQKFHQGAHSFPEEHMKITGEAIKNGNDVIGFADIKPLSEVFPLPESAQAQLTQVTEFLAKTKDDDNKSGAGASDNARAGASADAQEMANDLD